MQPLPFVCRQLRECVKRSLPFFQPSVELENRRVIVRKHRLPDIIKLLHDKELRYNMSTNALAASSKYSTEKYSENLLKVLKK